MLINVYLRRPGWPHRFAYLCMLRMASLMLEIRSLFSARFSSMFCTKAFSFDPRSRCSPAQTCSSPGSWLLALHTSAAGPQASRCSRESGIFCSLSKSFGNPNDLPHLLLLELLKASRLLLSCHSCPLQKPP